jgi:hypothetical protein
MTNFVHLDYMQWRRDWPIVPFVFKIRWDVTLVNIPFCLFESRLAS